MAQHIFIQRTTTNTGTVVSKVLHLCHYERHKTAVQSAHQLLHKSMIASWQATTALLSQWAQSVYIT